MQRGNIMIHRYHLDDFFIVIDTCSGSVHVVDEIAYEIIGCYEQKSREEILPEMACRFGEDPAEIAECYDQITELKEQGTLFSPDVFEPLAGELKKMEVPAVAVLGFRETPFLTEKFREAGCRTLVTSEVLNDRTFLGTVIDCMEINELKAPAYFACGPRGMLAAVDRYVSEDCGDECLQVSLEERMGCGYGVCVGCSVRIREKDGKEKEHIVRRRVCVDGPVFRGSEVIWHD